jgi:hypothetical protein
MFTDSDTESELVELMAASARHLDPPIEIIIDAAVRRGRRSVRNARIRGIAATVGVLALTAGATVGVFAVVRPFGTGDALGISAPSASTMPTVAPTTPPATPSGTTKPTPRTKPVVLSHEQVEAILADLMPPGRFVRLNMVTIPGETHYGANYFPGTRGFLLAIDIVPSSVPDASNSVCSLGGFVHDDGPRPAGAPPFGCDERNLPDGAHALLTVTNTDYSGLYEYVVILDRPDGMQVTMQLANGTETPSHGHPSTVNAATPPLTMDQLLTIAESDRWN